MATTIITESNNIIYIELIDVRIGLEGIAILGKVLEHNAIADSS